MDRWSSKVVVVSGASKGIGKQVTLDLLKHNVIVVGLARNIEVLDKMRNDLPDLKGKLNFHTYQCDVTKIEEVKKVFKLAEGKFGAIHGLINCAGVLRQGELSDGSLLSAARETMDINVMGTVNCVQAAFESMKSHKIDGHIILMNSMAGHTVPILVDQNIPAVSSYAASKHAITAMTEVYRQEFLRAGTRVKVSSISPGAVNTGIFPEALKNILNTSPVILDPSDVSSAIMYVMGTPPNVQIQDIIFQAL